MFGREPQLPIDFLLGQVKDPVQGEVQEWLLEHQARLQVAFEGACERLQAAATRRKERHDERVRDAPLSVGQRVYLQELGFKGRHKIQDAWSSVLYQVVKAPGEGPGYTIAPVNDLLKVRTVHRDLLKAVVQPDPPAPSTVRPPTAQVVTKEDSLVEDDLCLLVPETPLPCPPVESGPSETLDAGPRRCAASLQERPMSSVPSSLVIAGPSSSHQTVRRTLRSTAGQHSNVNHLP